MVIVGGGHNGLVAAFCLAKAGLKPLVLERKSSIGGYAVTEEIHPGFRCPTVVHTAGPLLPRIATELELERHGLGWLQPDVRVFSPAPDGRSLALYQDAKKTAEGLKALSEEMAAGRVDTLLILGGNPAYTAPSDVPFAAALGCIAYLAAIFARRVE